MAIISDIKIGDLIMWRPTTDAVDREFYIALVIDRSDSLFFGGLVVLWEGNILNWDSNSCEVINEN